MVAIATKGKGDEGGNTGGKGGAMLNSLYGDVTLPSADQAAQIDAPFANVHADQSNNEKNYT